MAKKKTSYLGNVAKEVKQTAKSASNAVDKYLNGNRALPKGIKIRPSNVKAEAGQLVGAVLQGRRYSDKTGKQITAKSPSVTGARRAKKVAGTPVPLKVRQPNIGPDGRVLKKVSVNPRARYAGKKGKAK